MVKITPSALITEIKGRWGGDSFQMWKGIITAKSSPSGVRNRTPAQQKIRGHLSDLSTCHYLLCSGQKTAWSTLASNHYPGKSGFNIFCSLNLNIRLSGISGLTSIPNPPSPFSRPFQPVQTHARYSCVTQKAYFSFASPISATTFIFTQISPQVYYSNKNSCNWITKKCTKSSKNIVPIDISKYPDDYKIRFRAKSISCYGVSSNFSGEVSTVKDNSFEFNPFIFISNLGGTQLLIYSTHSFGHCRTIPEPLPGYGSNINPNSFAVSDDYLFFFDTVNDKIVKLDKSSMEYISSFGGSGDGHYLFGFLCTICLDSNYLYVADYEYDRIRRYTLDSFTYAGTIANADVPFSMIDLNSIQVYGNFIYVSGYDNFGVGKILNWNPNIWNQYATLSPKTSESFNVSDICVFNDLLLIGDSTNGYCYIYSLPGGSYLGDLGEGGGYSTGDIYPDGLTFDDNYIYASSNFLQSIEVFFKDTFKYKTSFSGVHGSDYEIDSPESIKVMDKYYG